MFFFVSGPSSCNLVSPNAARYSTYSLVSDEVGARAVYTCQVGHYFPDTMTDRTRSSVCLDNNTWSVHVPDCARTIYSSLSAIGLSRRFRRKTHSDWGLPILSRCNCTDYV